MGDEPLKRRALFPQIRGYVGDFSFILLYLIMILAAFEIMSAISYYGKQGNSGVSGVLIDIQGLLIWNFLNFDSTQFPGLKIEILSLLACMVVLKYVIAKLKGEDILIYKANMVIFFVIFFTIIAGVILFEPPVLAFTMLSSHVESHRLHMYEAFFTRNRLHFIFFVLALMMAVNYGAKIYLVYKSKNEKAKERTTKETRT